MDLSQIDKEALLNPVINELGVLSQNVKDRLIIQLSAQIDRIILEGVGKFTTDILTILNAVNGATKEIKIEQKSTKSIISDIRADFESKLTKLVLSMRNMEELVKSQILEVKKEKEITKQIKLVENKKLKIEKEKDKKLKIEKEKEEKKKLEKKSKSTEKRKKKLIDKSKSAEADAELKSLKLKSFGELIKIAKAKKIVIEPRTKQKALIQQILDTEKGDIS